MVKTHNLGFPRIGAQRQLKFALERYWSGTGSIDSLHATAASVRAHALRAQAHLDLVPVGDFSFYDHVLDTSFLVGNVPSRVSGRDLDSYFRLARGGVKQDGVESGVPAAEMTKWFNTNYHYLVPEFDGRTAFALHASRLLSLVEEATQAGLRPKPVLLGPVTYLWLGKSKDGCDRLAHLPALLSVYRQLLATLAERGVEWVQMDEPCLVAELDPAWRRAVACSYENLSDSGPRLLLATYFGRLSEHASLVAGLPVHGVHLDLTCGAGDLDPLLAQWPRDRVLSLGAVDGRNVWKADLCGTLDRLEPIARHRENLWLAPSCSLLHVPVDLDLETELHPELRSWLAFAVQKLDEVHTLSCALNDGRAAVSERLQANRRSLAKRKTSRRAVDPQVRAATARITAAHRTRQSPFAARREKQQKRLALPPLPTTTIGSFPQTPDIRRARRRHLCGESSSERYEQQIQEQISRAIHEQEALGLDVLVHGEAERNDMVEYFGQQLRGYAFSKFGWVQSYGSRCVKPPILYGDVSRPAPMTVAYTTYAQSLTQRPVKGMLTGPVTILNWSFVRDDLSRRQVCAQIALAIRDEVVDLEAHGAPIIQIDEAALREGLPLRRSEWQSYLDWAVDCFKVASSGVRDETQIHTHMCYSEFNDILDAIAALDADVITIENSRSGSELLGAFDAFEYPNEIGPGVYDIHSPNTPSQSDVEALLRHALRHIPKDRLWVNPDCGLKTRSWAEVLPALTNMVRAAHALR